jgi:hypothetical protein
MDESGLRGKGDCRPILNFKKKEGEARRQQPTMALKKDISKVT